MAAAGCLRLLLFSALAGTAAAAAGPRVNMLTYFDIAVDKQPVGRIVFGLFKSCPITSENFRRLCTGEKGYGYKGTRFYKVWREVGLIGGIMPKHGSRSAYNQTLIKAEHFRLKHTAPYLLAMETEWPEWSENFTKMDPRELIGHVRGTKMVGSTFMILTQMAPHLDDEQVVFGTVIEGHNVIDQIKRYELPKANPKDEKEAGGEPSREIRITNAGELPLARPFSTTLGEAFPWEEIMGKGKKDLKVSTGGQEYLREAKQATNMLGLAGPAPAELKQESDSEESLEKARKKAMERDAVDDPALLAALEYEAEEEERQKKEAPAPPAPKAKPTVSKWEL